MAESPKSSEACACGHDHDHAPGHNHDHAHDHGDGKEYKNPLACPCCGEKKSGGGGWLMVVGIIVVIGLVVLLKTTTKPLEPTTEEPTAPGGFTAVQLKQGERIVLAAADAKDVTEPFSLKKDPPGGFSGTVLYVGPEKWNDSWKEKADKGQVKAEDFKKGHPDAAYPGFATLAFTAPKTAKYELWLRAYWVDQCGDSMGLSLDGAAPVTAIDSNHARWVWTPVRSGEGRPLAFNLEAGPHTLTLLNREDDCYVAKVLFREMTGATLPPPAEND